MSTTSAEEESRARAELSTPVGLRVALFAGSSQTFLLSETSFASSQASRSWSRLALEWRLSGQVTLAVKETQEAAALCAQDHDDEHALRRLREMLHLLLALSADADCAEEIGLCGGHRLLRNAAKACEWPWTEASVADAVAEIIAQTLSVMASMITVTPVGALDVRQRPFEVHMDKGGNRAMVVVRQVREEVAEAGVGERANVRVGYRLWGGALVLGVVLFQLGCAGKLKGKKILEIGAGLGLSGLVAAQSGFHASHVCLTDFHPRIVDNLAYNIAVNGESLVEECSAEILDWVQVGATKEQDPAKLYDLVIGSDIVCERSDCDLVADVLRARLSRDGIAIVTLGSQDSRFGVDHFASTLREAGFLVTEATEVYIPPICLASTSVESQQAANDGEVPVFIGTAMSYLHYTIRFQD